MKILGITFAGTSTDARPEMTAFVSDVLGLARLNVEGVEADLFGLPDGSQFAVAWPGGMGAGAQSLGFVVEDLDEAIAELKAAGVECDDTASGNADMRYFHFHAPDGHVYELVEPRVSKRPSTS